VTPGERFQGLHIASDECFLFGARPALDLNFSLFSLLNGFVVFLVDEFGRGIKSCCPATMTVEVSMDAAVEMKR